MFRGLKNCNVQANVEGSADKTKDLLFSGFTVTFFPFSFSFTILVGRGSLRLQIVLNDTKFLEKKKTS